MGTGGRADEVGTGMEERRDEGRDLSRAEESEAQSGGTVTGGATRQVMRSYRSDISRVLDVCRQCIVFETLADLTRCLRVIYQDKVTALRRSSLLWGSWLCGDGPLACRRMSRVVEEGGSGGRLWGVVRRWQLLHSAGRE